MTLFSKVLRGVDVSQRMRHRRPAPTRQITDQEVLLLADKASSTPKSTIAGLTMAQCSANNLIAVIDNFATQKQGNKLLRTVETMAYNLKY